MVDNKYFWQHNVGRSAAQNVIQGSLAYGTHREPFGSRYTGTAFETVSGVVTSSKAFVAVHAK